MGILYLKFKYNFQFQLHIKGTLNELNLVSLQVLLWFGGNIFSAMKYVCKTFQVRTESTARRGVTERNASYTIYVSCTIITRLQLFSSRVGGVHQAVSDKRSSKVAAITDASSDVSEIVPYPSL